MLNNRNSVLAIALIMVVVYHFPYNPIGRFNIGYMGVDIFLFYSGYGICKSLLKNKIATFYKNRLKRIFPMFAVLTLCMAALKGTLNDISLLLQQITTLAFYVNPDYATDWYLSSLFLFYLLSPACLFIVKKCKQGVRSYPYSDLFVFALHRSAYVAISMFNRKDSNLYFGHFLFIL